MRATKKPWTRRHVEESDAAFYRLASEATVRGDAGSAACFADCVRLSAAAASEWLFAEALARLLVTHRDAAKILRMVRARAEGREVVTVEVFWRVRLADGRYMPKHGGDSPCRAPTEAWSGPRQHAETARVVEGPGARVVRVTLTRRRIVRAPKGG
jgi:hypothetical protein